MPLAVVDLGNYRVTDSLHLPHLRLNLIPSRTFLTSFFSLEQPRLSLCDSLLDGVFVVSAELFSQLVFVFDSVSHVVDVRLQGVLGIDSLLDLLVLLCEHLSVFDHLFYLILCQATLIVSD